VFDNVGFNIFDCFQGKRVQVGGVAEWLGRQYLAGGLSLINI